MKPLKSNGGLYQVALDVVNTLPRVIGFVPTSAIGIASVFRLAICRPRSCVSCRTEFVIKKGIADFAAHPQEFCEQMSIASVSESSSKQNWG